MTVLSVIIPVYYNQESLPLLYQRLNLISKKMKDIKLEMLFVDDGSGDDSYKVLTNLAKKDSRIKIIKLTSNFGSFTA